ncbi:MAG TPA: transposase [Verrucomicrobiota bacterium]|nr:transposase [Verrucomicrobiota bacterium]HNU50738.1 transposase [Verrucomicrobiota bacterium]
MEDSPPTIWVGLWERYVESQSDYRASAETLGCKLGEAGADAWALLQWVRRPEWGAWAQGAHVQLLERVFGEQFKVVGGQAALRAQEPTRVEGREIIGPAQPAPRKDGRFNVEDFAIRVEDRQAVCPAGRRNTQCSRLEEVDRVKVSYRFEFSTACQGCALRARCLGQGQAHRTLVVGEHHTLLQHRRQEQQTEAFRQRMKQRNAIEGTQSEPVRGHRLRRARSRGLAKAKLQNYFIGAACNVKRWLRHEAWTLRQRAAVSGAAPAVAATPALPPKSEVMFAQTLTPQAEGPAEVLTPPRWFGAVGTYGRNVMFWRSAERSDRSATAVIIERREGDDGRWHAISPGIRDVDRCFDDDVRLGRSYSYRARSLAGARHSEFTPVRSASARDPSQWSLPVYELTTSLLLSGALDAMIEHNFARLKSEYVVGPYRVAFEGPDPFLRSGQDLKRFVRQHGERLRRFIAQERNRKASAVVINELSFGAESGWVELHNRGSEAVSLRGYLLVTKGKDGNRELPLSDAEVPRPNDYTVLTCPRLANPQRVSRRNNEDAPRDDAPGASVQSDRDVAQPFPGFDPAVEFIGLVRCQPVSKLERREDLVDFWHYGPRPVGRSYGRLGAEFAELEPTPGRANIRAITK